MKRMKHLAIIGTTALALSACAQNPEREAKAFSQAAERCLLDVRDRQMKYEGSPNCEALEGLSMAYMEAGGRLEGEPIETRLIAEEGRATAWNAVAVSATGNPTISLWSYSSKDHVSPDLPTNK